MFANYARTLSGKTHWNVHGLDASQASMFLNIMPNANISCNHFIMMFLLRLILQHHFFLLISFQSTDYGSKPNLPYLGFQTSTLPVGNIIYYH